MFDISFSELLVIAIVALVVIGPEKLPKVARTAGAFFGRMQRFVTQVKEEVNREARFAELQKLQDEVKSSLQQGYDDVAQSILPEVEAVPPEAQIVLEPVKKTRQPRSPKVSKATEAAAGEVEDKPRRKRATAQSEKVVVTEQQLASGAEPLADNRPAPRLRKPRAAKPQPNTDLFAMDEPVNEPGSE